MKKILSIFEKSISTLAIFCLGVMITLVLSNVAMRYLLNTGIPWSEEGARIGFVWVVFLGVILAARDKDHLIVDVFSSRAGPKTKLVLTLLVRAITVFIMYAVTVGGLKLMAMTWDQPLPATGLSGAIIYAAGVFGAVCIILMTLWDCYPHKNKNGDT
jgi:TRAP-type C4-dicarboxylate transport system permease small subunit